MMKKRKLFTCIIGTALVAMMSISPVLVMGADDAPTPTPAPFQYVPISGPDTTDSKKISFIKELVMDSEANIPAATFSFSVEPYNSEKNNGEVVIAANTTNKTLAVMNGPVAKQTEKDGTIVTAPSIEAVTFVAGDTANETMTIAENSPKEGKKTASKTAVIDFSGVNFTEPGVYRYLITESGTNQGITNDSELIRTLDVYVKDNNGSLEIESYVMYSGKVDNAPKAEATDENAVTPTPNGAEPEDATKTDKYINTYDTSNVTFSKTVTGNQGSKDKYFKFTVTISNAVAGTKYDVDLSKADKTNIPANPNAATTCISESVKNPTVITVDSNATSSTVTTACFYLQDGQSITIKGLAKNTTCTVTEAPEDYSPSVDITEGVGFTNVAGKVGGTGTIQSDDVNIALTNTRSGVIPTGIDMSFLPILFVGLIAICGVTVLVIRARRKEA